MQDQKEPEISVIDDGKLPLKREATPSEEGNNPSEQKTSSNTNNNNKGK